MGAEYAFSIDEWTLTQWMAFARMSPLPDERADVLAAHVRQGFVGGALSEHLVQWDAGRKTAQTPEEMIALLANEARNHER